MESNRENWQELFDEYEQKMVNGNDYMNEIIQQRKLPGSKPDKLAKHRR